MTFKPQHFGLYFGPEQVHYAQENRDHEPLLAAWLMLRDRSQTGTTAILWHAFRYLFNEDLRAGESAISALEQAVTNVTVARKHLINATGEAIMLAQAFEMLRRHPAMDAAAQRRFIDALNAKAAELQNSPERDLHVEELWLAALQMVSGIVMEQVVLFDAAVDLFQRTIAEEVRPQGHIPKAVNGTDGGAYTRQLLSSVALVLMAEAASQVGVDLWAYSVRGVSVMTTAVYPIYYYYTTERWKWDAHLQPEDVQRLFARYSGYLEMVYRRMRHKDLKTLLDDLRPVFSPHAGGLTTLTHAQIERKRGLFG